eukprot:1314203-Rhodomonas_salina.5
MKKIFTDKNNQAQKEHIVGFPCGARRSEQNALSLRCCAVSDPFQNLFISHPATANVRRACPRRLCSSTVPARTSNSASFAPEGSLSRRQPALST